MKYIKSLFIVLLAASFVVSCKPSKKMTPEEFLKIENEILTTDLSTESTSQVVKKYGYTLDQYKAFEQKIDEDMELKTKMGELRLKMQKDED